MGIDVAYEPDPERGISLTCEDFLYAVDRQRVANFPIEHDPADARPYFKGWRVNYEAAAYAVARPLMPCQRCGRDPPYDIRYSPDLGRLAAGVLPVPASRPELCRPDDRLPHRDRAG